MTFVLSGKCEADSRCAARLSIAVGVTAALVQFASAMQVEGDDKALTVVLQDDARPQVVAVLAKRLGFRVVGTVVDDGTVSGRFRGDLAKVLSSVLPQNGFVIVYESGKPSRLLLSAKDPNGATSMPVGGNSLMPNGYNAAAPVDPNATYLPVPSENPEGGVYQPDPTEMPVENLPEVQPQQGIVE